MIYFNIMTTRAKQRGDSVKVEGIQEERNWKGHQEEKQKAPTNLAMGSLVAQLVKNPSAVQETLV